MNNLARPATSAELVRRNIQRNAQSVGLIVEVATTAPLKIHDLVEVAGALGIAAWRLLVEE